MAQLKIFKSSLLLLLLISDIMAIRDDQFLDISNKDTEKMVNTTVAQSESKAVIELLLVCDYDFSLVFNFQRTEVIKYFESLLWDVHLKYKTLKNVDISFQVNEIIIIESPEEQPFVESVRNNETGKVDVRQVLKSFFKFLYFENMSNYDIAVAAVGADGIGVEHGVAGIKGACMLNRENEEVWSSLVFSTKTQNPAWVLAHEIAHLLGVPHDSNPECNDSVYRSSFFEHYIMHPSEDAYGTNAFYFSSCSSGFIEGFLRTYQANFCLRNSTFTDSPIIDTSNPSSISPVGLSLEKQCQIFLNDTSSVKTKAEVLISTGLNISTIINSTCEVTACKSGNANTIALSAISSLAEYKFLIPFGGTQCDDADASKRCILGLCIFPGFQLVSSLTGDCARSLDYYSSDDSLSMYYYYSGLQSPFNLINIKNGSKDSLLLSSLYITEAGNNVSTKCLTLTDWEPTELWMIRTLSSRLGFGGPHFIAIFQECSEHPSLYWDIIWTEEPGSSQFFLKHRDTQMCISSVPILDKIIGTSCQENEKFLGWEFVAENRTTISQKSLKFFLGKLGQNANNEVSSERYASWLWTNLNDHFALIISLFSFSLILAIFGFLLVLYTYCKLVFCRKIASIV